MAMRLVVRRSGSVAPSVAVALVPSIVSCRRRKRCSIRLTTRLAAKLTSKCHKRNESCFHSRLCDLYQSTTSPSHPCPSSLPSATRATDLSAFDRGLGVDDDGRLRRAHGDRVVGDQGVEGGVLWGKGGHRKSAGEKEVGLVSEGREPRRGLSILGERYQVYTFEACVMRSGVLPPKAREVRYWFADTTAPYSKNRTSTPDRPVLGPLPRSRW